MKGWQNIHYEHFPIQQSQQLNQVLQFENYKCIIPQADLLELTFQLNYCISVNDLLAYVNCGYVQFAECQFENLIVKILSKFVEMQHKQIIHGNLQSLRNIWLMFSQDSDKLTIYSQQNYIYEIQFIDYKWYNEPLYNNKVQDFVDIADVVMKLNHHCPKNNQARYTQLLNAMSIVELQKYTSKYEIQIPWIFPQRVNQYKYGNYETGIQKLSQAKLNITQQCPMTLLIYLTSMANESAIKQYIKNIGQSTDGFKTEFINEQVDHYLNLTINTIYVEVQRIHELYQNKLTSAFKHFESVQLKVIKHPIKHTDDMEQQYHAEFYDKILIILKMRNYFSKGDMFQDKSILEEAVDDVFRKNLMPMIKNNDRQLFTKYIGESVSKLI